jgi:hypothetical protein
MDDRPPGWVQHFPSRRGTVGQMIRLAGAPAADPASETWPRPQRFSGPLTWIFPLVSAAETTWSMSYREVIKVPKQLADREIRAGRARLAKPAEIPESDEGE